MPGFGHAESAADGPLLDRIAQWVREQALAAQAVPGVGVEEMQ